MTNAMQSPTPDEQARAHADAIKKRAATKKAAAALAAAPVFRSVDRATLASFLAPYGIDVSEEDFSEGSLPMPSTLIGVPVLMTHALRVKARHYGAAFQGQLVHEQEDEHAALRALASAGEAFGEEELWGIRTSRHGVQYFWATASAVQASYPDHYTRELRRHAGIGAPATEEMDSPLLRALSPVVDKPQTIQRFPGVSRPIVE